jgi:hypothetical protein
MKLAPSNTEPSLCLAAGRLVASAIAVNALTNNCSASVKESHRATAGKAYEKRLRIPIAVARATKQLAARGT